MVTLELRTYVQEQLRTGASAETIKNALLQAGWSQSDIETVMNETKSGGANIQTAPKISSSPMGNLSATGPQTSPIISSSKPAFIASDIFQPKNEPLFQPKPSSSPRIVDVNKKSKDLTSYKKIILPGILLLVIAALVVAAGFFYSQTSALNDKISSGSNQVNSLSQEVNSLTGDKNNLTNEVNSLNSTINDLNSDLSLFVIPPTISSSTELSIDLKGILAGGGKKLYNLTDDKGIFVYVANSKDKNVDASLKPLVGQQAEISGTHLPASNYVTVSSINGQSVPPVTASSSVTGAPSASSTSTNSTATSTNK